MIRMHKKLWIRMNATVQLTLRIVWVAIGLHFLILFQVIIIWNIRVMACSHFLPSERNNKGLLFFKHHGSLFCIDSRGHRSKEIVPSPLRSERWWLNRNEKGYHQTSAVYRKQQKEDEATRRYSIYKWNWTYMITPVISRLKTGVYVVSLVV